MAFIALLAVINLSVSTNPIAVFHGLGDLCLNTSFTNYFASKLGVYARCIESGGLFFDFLTSFEYQAEYACNTLKKDKNFHGDFNVIGISQGALIARYIIEKCEMPGRVKRYISIGGPQMGVGKFPHCDTGMICDTVNYVVDKAVYFRLIQGIVGPAGYFKDVRNYKEYLNYSTFLSDLNNEKEAKNQSYKDRMLGLERMILIKFTEDTMIIPKETAWFQFYDANGELQKLEDSELYQKDFIGVKTLNEQGKIDFFKFYGDHLDFGTEEIDKYMIPYLE